MTDSSTIARRTGAPRGYETVLVVEDEAAVRGLMTRVLEQLGYTVRAVSSPAEAIAFADAGHPIDVILTDVMLPGMNGPAMIGELRARNLHPAVVYMSGHSPETIRRLDFLRPSTLFIRKPFTGNTLATVIRHALDTALPPIAMAEL